MKIFFLFDSSNNYKKKYFKRSFKSNKNFKFFFVEEIKKIKKCEIVFLISYTKIINIKLLSKAKLKLIVHESALPYGRGCAPVQWQILEKKKSFGICILEVEKKFDTGKIFFKDSFTIKNTALYNEIRDTQSKANIKIIKKFLKKYPNIEPKNQKGKVKYFKKRSLYDSEININKSIKNQFNLLRINNNLKWPSYFYFNGQKYILKIFKK